MIQNEYIFRIYVIIAMLSMTLCACFTMISQDGDNPANHISLIYLGTFLLLIPNILFYLRHRIVIKPQSSIIWLDILFIWIVITSLLNGGTNIKVLFSCLGFLIAMLSMHTMYEYSSNYGICKLILWAAVAMMLILTLWYVNIYSIANLISEAHLLTAYYPLFMLPLVMTHHSKIVRYSSVVLITLVILSSVKRGGIIALAFGLIVYIVCYYHIKSNTMKAIIYTIVTLVIIGIGFYYIADSELGRVFERMAKLTDDDGSGRTDVWRATWEMIQRSQMTKFIIGHGANAVRNDSYLYLSAHNDFLEAFYDYGIVGVILYIIALLSLIFYTLRQIICKSSIAPQLAMLLSIMVILTMISHVLIYYFMVLCCMTIGLLLGQEKYEKIQTAKAIERKNLDQKPIGSEYEKNDSSKKQHSDEHYQ